MQLKERKEKKPVMAKEKEMHSTAKQQRLQGLQLTNRQATKKQRYSFLMAE